MRRSVEERAAIKEKAMEFIILYIQIYGYAPNYNDIAGELKCSKSQIGSILDGLENDGKLMIGRDGKKRMPRAISVVGYKYIKED